MELCDTPGIIGKCEENFSRMRTKVDLDNKQLWNLII
jgi:hypothetical protein